MNHSKKLELKISKDNPTKDLKKQVQYHLTEKKQLELINELLKVLPEPPEIVQKFANLHSNRNQQGGYLDATKRECWIMTKQDYERHENEKAKRVFTKETE